MEEKKDIFDFIEKRPIETPDADYFKSLADKVISDVAEEPEEPQAKIIPLYRRSIVWISGVAAAILVAFLLLPETTGTGNLDPLAFSDEPSREEVLAYVNDNIDDFDEELLVEFIAMKNLGSEPVLEQTIEPEEEPLETIIETETQDLQESLKNISDEEILEYLELEGELDENEDDFILL